MATHAPIMGASTRAPAFKLNDVSVVANEPYPYLDQAHALSICLTDAVAGGHALNDDILESAIRGITTLIEMAALGLDVMDRDREDRA